MLRGKKEEKNYLNSSLETMDWGFKSVIIMVLRGSTNTKIIFFLSILFFSRRVGLIS